MEIDQNVNRNNYKELIQSEYLDFKLEYKMTGIAKTFDRFLKPEIAEACYKNLNENVEFVPHIYGTLTNMQCANRPLRKVYDGEIIHRKRTSETDIFEKVLELFRTVEFEQFVSNVLGEPVHYIRPATPYKFHKGNYLCLHDDMSDSYHTCEVVLNLTKNWHKSYGGYSIGGYVKRRDRVKTPEEFPFYLNRIVLNRSKPFYCSLPVFNKLSILRLSEDLCHGTTMVNSDNSRYVIAAIYAGNKEKKITTQWKEEKKYEI